MNYFEFNFHDYASMRVAANAPTAALAREIFLPFLDEGIERFDLTVTRSSDPLDSPAHTQGSILHASNALYLPRTRIRIEVEDSAFKLSGGKELLTTILPLLDIILVGQGAAMIHAAAFEFQGHGIALPAWGGSGKTSSLQRLIQLHGASFMADDWAFASHDGRLLGFAKPMFIKPHHRAVYPHLFNGRRKLLVPSLLSEPLSRLTTAVHPAVAQFPRIASFSRRWSPEHLMVDPARAFPGTTITESAPLDAVIFMERARRESLVLEERDTAWMVSRLVGNFHTEMPRHSRDLIQTLAATSLLSLHEHFGDKANILTKALNGKPTFLLQVPHVLKADRASLQIAEQIMQTLTRVGLA